MKYSRERINKAGKVITHEIADVIEHAEAMNVIDNWRKDHLPVLDLLVKEISAILESHEIETAFSSSRLKRMTSIRSKLIHNPGMCLGGVQDIGGARYVFNDISSLYKAKDILEEKVPTGFTLEKEPYDYVAKPKASGYRSIHFVYKYHSNDDILDGKRVELQLRTKLQHDWATAVETAEMISKSALKASAGNEDWQNFFKLTGAIFARRENQPVNEEFADYTEKDYCREYGRMLEEQQFLEKLKAAFMSVEISKSKEIESGYILLVSDLEKKQISIRHFEESNTDEASEIYAHAEASLDESKNMGVAVLVSVKDIVELRQAYPSYFLNAKEFIEALGDFSQSCKRMGF